MKETSAFNDGGGEDIQMMMMMMCVCVCVVCARAEKSCGEAGDRLLRFEFENLEKVLRFKLILVKA